MLGAEVALARGELANAFSALQKPVPPGFAEESLRRRIDLANTLIRLRRPQEARRILDQAEPAVQQSSSRDLRFQAEIVAGMLKAPTEAAEEIFGRVSAEAARVRDDYSQAAALINLAYCRAQTSRFETAAEFGEQAVAAAERARAKRLQSAALLNLGLSYSRLGQFDRAIEKLRRAQEYAESVQDPVLVMNILGEQGNLFILAGEPSKAVEPYERAFIAAKQAKLTPVAAMWASNLARGLIEVGRWDDADKWNNTALSLTSPQDRRNHIYLESNRAVIQNARGDRNSALELYRKTLSGASDYPELEWSIHSSLGSLYSQQKDYASADREYEIALRLIEKRWAAMSNDRFRMTFLDRLIRFYQSYVDVLVQQGKQRKALQVAERSRARILAERVGTPQIAADTDFRPEALSREAGAVLLSYWIAPARSFAWVVTPAGIHMQVLPPADKIAALVASYRDSLEERLQDPLERASGHELYQAVLEPVRKWIPPKSQVLVVPDGVLHQVNLETLPVKEPVSHYWIDDVTLAVVPSLTVLGHSAAGTSRSALLIGAPLAAGDRYPALANSAAEMSAIRSSLGASNVTLCEGASATPECFLAPATDSVSIIHFAAHAEANRDSPLDSAVILSPGRNGYKLYAHELLKRKLDANLVTISACRGAGARSYSGEGLIGFAWAFMQAGAKTVVAGLWDVPDASTSGLMKQFYAGIGQGMAPAAALRKAKLTYVHSNSAYRRPFYWAPFQTYIRVVTR